MSETDDIDDQEYLDTYANNVELNPNLHSGQFGGKSVKRVDSVWTSRGREHLLTIDGGEPTWYGPTEYDNFKKYGRERKKFFGV